jgi:hypothetical protein
MRLDGFRCNLKVETNTFAYRGRPVLFIADSAGGTTVQILLVSAGAACIIAALVGAMKIAMIDIPATKGFVRGGLFVVGLGFLGFSIPSVDQSLALSFVNVLLSAKQGSSNQRVVVTTPSPPSSAHEAASDSTSVVPSSASLMCESDHDTWGKKRCGATTILFQDVHSGNDTGIITQNVGPKPIWIKIVPYCNSAPQCGKTWIHRVRQVDKDMDGSGNENLTVNEQGVKSFSWEAWG